MIVIVKRRGGKQQIGELFVAAVTETQGKEN